MKRYVPPVSKDKKVVKFNSVLEVLRWHKNIKKGNAYIERTSFCTRPCEVLDIDKVIISFLKRCNNMQQQIFEKYYKLSKFPPSTQGYDYKFMVIAFKYFYNVFTVKGIVCENVDLIDISCTKNSEVMKIYKTIYPEVEQSIGMKKLNPEFRRILVNTLVQTSARNYFESNLLLSKSENSFNLLAKNSEGSRYLKVHHFDSLMDDTDSSKTDVHSLEVCLTI